MSVKEYFKNALIICAMALCPVPALICAMR